MDVNKVYLSDVFDFLDMIENKSIDLAIIDPPYNQNVAEWDKFTTEDFLKFTFNWLDSVLKKMKSTGSIYIFNNSYNAALILSYLKDKNICFKNWITWYKKDGFVNSKLKFVNNQETILFFTMTEEYTFNADNVRVPYNSASRMESAKKKGILKNGKRWYPNEKGKLCTDVWEFTSVRHLKKVKGKVVSQKHPTPKPEGMVERMILASSNEKDLVLDLFSGTGTTSYIAKKNNRNFIGCDNSIDYIDLINERLNSI